MATLENIAKRRAVALGAITDALTNQAAERKIELRPFPVLSRQQDPNHRELALVEWIHDGLVATGFIAALAPAAETPPGGEGEGADLAKLTKEKLLAIAKDRNVTSVTQANTKAEIIAALAPAAETPPTS